MSNTNNQLPLFVAKNKNPLPSKANPNFSDYIVFVDESGDHSLQSIDPQYPIFVLAFCVCHKQHYSEAIVPALEKLKFNYFGHDQIVLHEHEIRKEKGAFTIFNSRKEKHQFLNELTQIIEYNNFILISCTIDKRNITKASDKESNPYHTALGLCMESLHDFLNEKSQLKKKRTLLLNAGALKKIKI